ncbi:MAG: hypothetical protein ED557_05770 [Balneola sp.]|nr:MAG: hypothetical protein ED557_05770 [Balneola sp.]
MKIKFGVLLIVSFCAQQLVTAQEQTEIQQKSYYTQKIAGEAPRIDGFVDEDSWNMVEWSGDFTQISPDHGAEPSQPTAIKILYDDNYLYVAIRAFDDEPDKIVKRLSRRDGFEGDWVEINIDSYNDKRTAFSFTATVAGVKGDEAISNDGNNWDSSWDPLWDFETSIDNEGWIAEMRIPFTQLRFDANENQEWGMQFTRRFFRNQERSTWQYFSQEDAGWVSNFGKLHGIRGIKPKRQIEIAPYTVAKAERYEAEAGNPFRDGSDESLSLGLDGKIGITNDFTVDFTINPDFGQVEADPSEVNLTAFESFFQERRPFFIEGRNITSFQITGGGNPYSSDNLFYSRRIGRSPQNFPDVDSDLNEYADVPQNTTILGAVKLTGKTQNGLSIGIVESLTSAEYSDVSRNGISSEEIVEPLTNYFLASVQQETNESNTVFGGMFTATNRDINDASLENLNTSAYTGGLNFEHYWNDRTYYVRANMIASHITGSQEAILSQQESSRRFFQRPDNDYTTYDPTRTSLTGTGGNIEVGKQASSGWRYLGWLTWRSPELELNDLGFLRRGDSIFQVLWAGYRFANPIGIFRNANLNFNQWTGWDFGGTNSFKGGNFNINGQLKNYWFVSGGMDIEGEEVSNTFLRGGPSMQVPGGYSYYFNVNTDSRKQLSFGTNHSQFFGFDNSANRKNFGFSVRYIPTDAFRIFVRPSLNIFDGELQYMTTTSDLIGDDAYIFGDIDQVTTSITMRLDYVVSPDFTIQYYGSPFISAVDYSDPKVVTNPRADNFEDRFSRDVSFSSEDYVNDYDFNFRQFRSNLVLRWEYRPGSLVFLVWTQGRTDFDDSTGGFNYGSGFDELFSVKPENVFLIKFSYLLGM